MRDTIEITVRGGFPLVATLEWCPREPDVGIMSDYYEVADVCTERGRQVDFLKLTDEEINTAIDKALDQTR